jgi:hypothetical protein
VDFITQELTYIVYVLTEKGKKEEQFRWEGLTKVKRLH